MKVLLTTLQSIHIVVYSENHGIYCAYIVRIYNDRFSDSPANVRAVDIYGWTNNGLLLVHCIVFGCDLENFPIYASNSFDRNIFMAHNKYIFVCAGLYRSYRNRYAKDRNCCKVQNSQDSVTLRN